MYRNHPSVISIQKLAFEKRSFSFRPISEEHVQTAISNIDTSKSYQKDNIPPKILEASVAVGKVFLNVDINNCIVEGKFPSNLKNADICSIFKKLDHLCKANYRPVSILPTLSKVYEKIFHQQIYEYFNFIFSKYLCGFRRGHSTQHCLLFMLEKLKRALDKGQVTGILLTDLSKAFDSISHELLIAKLYAYGFSIDSLKLINDYLSDRMQRTKVGETFSTWRRILFGFPQGTILGPLLFNIYINDLFLSSPDFEIANYADDNSHYDVIKKLEEDAFYLLKWYENNYLMPNPDK